MKRTTKHHLARAATCVAIAISAVCLCGCDLPIKPTEEQMLAEAQIIDHEALREAQNQGDPNAESVYDGEVFICSGTVIFVLDDRIVLLESETGEQINGFEVYFADDSMDSLGEGDSITVVGIMNHKPLPNLCSLENAYAVS